MRSGYAALSVPFWFLITFHRATYKARSEYYNATAVFQQLHAVKVLHQSWKGRTLAADGRGNIHCHNIARVVVVVAADRLGQRAEECFKDGAQRIIWIQDLMHPCVYLVVKVVIMGETGRPF